MDLPNLADLQRIGRDAMLSQNGALRREIIERAGTDANIFLAAISAVGDEVMGQLAHVATALYLDSATGQDLTRLVFDRYGLVRKNASPALGSVSFTTVNPALAAFTIPTGTVVSTSGGTQYLTLTTEIFGLGSVGPLVIAVRSTLGGLGQQAAANTINSIASQIAGAPADLRVNNPLATSGADDAEADESLRDRARQFFTTARRGTLGAIVAGALAVPGVQRAAAFEVLDTLGQPARAVQLVVADAFTDSLVASNPPAYQAQSQQLAVVVANALGDVRAAGITVNVTVAQVVLQGLQLGLTFRAGFDANEVAQQARAMLAAYVNSLAPGATLFRSTLTDLLRTIHGLLVTGNEVLVPAGDVVPLALQVLRTTVGSVTPTSLQPDRPILSTRNPDAFIPV